MILCRLMRTVPNDEVLVLLSKIYYEMGNINECEKYISYAMIIDNSRELKKLFYLCKLFECKNMIKNKTISNEYSLFNKALEHIETAGKILAGTGTNFLL